MKISTRSLLQVSLLSLGLTSISDPVQATDYVWSGSISGASSDWFSNKNWKISASTPPTEKLSLAPGGTEDVAIEDGLARRIPGVPGSGDTATLTAGAVVTTQAPLTLAKLTIEGGSTLQSSAPITVISTLAVRDSQLLGSGKLIIASKATATFSSQKTDDFAGNIVDKAVENLGTVNWVSGKFSLRQDFRNWGDFNLSADAVIQTAEGVTPTFYNEGALTKSGGGRSAIALPFINAGEIYLRSGLLDVGPKYVQTDGSLHLDGGDLSSSGTLQVEGGTVGGIGTLNCDVVNSGGTLNPGHSPGIITINGNYTQTAGGTLGMEVGGVDPGTGYDQLIINGAAYLGGNLDIVKYNNYAPYAGQNFRFIDCFGIQGNFDSFSGLYPGGYLYYKLICMPDYYIAFVNSDNTPPTVSISTPVHNGSYAGVSSVKGIANDATYPSGIKSVTIVLYRYANSSTPAGFLLPGNTWSSTYSGTNQLLASGTTNWTRSFSALAPGQYHVKASATDNVGRTASTSNHLFNVSSASSGYVSLPASPAKRSRIAFLASDWKLRTPKAF